MCDAHPPIRALLFTAACLVLSACGSGATSESVSIGEALSVDTTGFQHAQPGYTMVFPRDHGAHPDFYLEWWYFTGNLFDQTGRRFGYQFTIFRNALAPPGTDEAAEDTSAWSTRQLYSAHLAVSDPSAGRFLNSERFARGAVGLAGARVSEEDGLRVWVEDWSIEGGADLSGLRLRADGEDHALDLELQPAKPIFLQGQDGYSPKGLRPDQASHYYSVSRLTTMGTMVAGEDTFRVSGSSWFDREWSTSLLAPDQTGWDWFSLQLDTGQDLMYFRLRSTSGNDFVDGSLIGDAGQRESFRPESISLTPVEYWTSPESGVRYPITWLLESPTEGTRLSVSATIPNQELNTRVRYWEGSVNVSGTLRQETISGVGYVELTGYDS